MIKYLSVKNVIELNKKIINRSGGLHGLRDMNLLESAVLAPQVVLYGTEMYPSIHEKAGAYLFHLTKNHPFLDGNKRTSVIAVITFFEVNKAQVKFSDEDIENVVCQVAENKLNKSEIFLFMEFGKIPVYH